MAKSDQIHEVYILYMAAMALWIMQIVTMPKIR